MQAAQATFQAQQDLVTGAEADLKAATARTHQANAAKSTVAATQADLKNAIAQKNQAAVRLGYSNVYAPVSGTVSVRAARQGEVVNIGAPIVTIVDLNDTWARAAIPETYRRPYRIRRRAARSSARRNCDQRQRSSSKGWKETSLRSAMSAAASAISKPLC